MDWGYVLGTVIASVVASGVTSAVVAISTFRMKFERMDATTDQRVKDWEKWRVQLEERLNARADHLAAHEKECRERWEKLMREHGELQAQMRGVLDSRRRQR